MGRARENRERKISGEVAGRADQVILQLCNMPVAVDSEAHATASLLVTGW